MILTCGPAGFVFNRHDEDSVSRPKDLGISGYEIVEPLGSNGATVFLAREVATARLVALKVWSGPRVSEYQRREAGATKLRHPNILTVLEVGETAAGRFSVLEWLPKTEGLPQWLRRAVVDRLEAARVVEAIACAVQHAREPRSANPAGRMWPESLACRVDGRRPSSSESISGLSRARTVPCGTSTYGPLVSGG
jgi:hypothetical protein